MTPNEFWYDEPRLLDSYIKKRELELDTINYQSWLIGLYVNKAVGTVLENAFSKKGSIQSTYFEKPLEELNSTKKIVQEQQTTYKEQYNIWAKFGKKGV